jgi:hypothetical protein
MGLSLEAALKAAYGGDPRNDNQCPDFRMLKDLEQQISTAAEEGIQQARGGGGTDNSSGSGSGMSSASSQASSGAAATVIKEGPLWFVNKAGKRVTRFFQLVNQPSSTGSAHLTLVAFKADPNPQRLQPPPVGSSKSASAR